MEYNLLAVKLIPFHMGKREGGWGRQLSGGRREWEENGVTEKLETVREGRDSERITNRADRGRTK